MGDLNCSELGWLSPPRPTPQLGEPSTVVPAPRADVRDESKPERLRTSTIFPLHPQHPTFERTSRAGWRNCPQQQQRKLDFAQLILKPDIFTTFAHFSISARK